MNASNRILTQHAEDLDRVYGIVFRDVPRADEALAQCISCGELLPDATVSEEGVCDACEALYDDEHLYFEETLSADDRNGGAQHFNWRMGL